MTFKGDLRQYQQEAMERLVDRGQMLLGIVMGGGKTVVTLAAIEELHAADDVDRCIVVVPASLKFQWLAEIKKFTDAKATVIDGTKAQRDKQWRMSFGSRYVIVNPETLMNDVDRMGTYQCLVIDECFPAGTPVDTTNGPVPIELIEPGMWVRNAAGLGQVEAVRVSQASSLVRITMDDGRETVSTPNHPVLTRNGWTTMVKLQHDEELITTREAMRMVRSGLDRKGSPSPVLQHVLLSEMAESPDVVAGGSGVRLGEAEGERSFDGAPADLLHHDGREKSAGPARQSVVDGGVDALHEEFVQGTRARSVYSWREWAWSNRASTDPFGSAGDIVDLGTHSAYGYKAARWTADALQDRLGVPPSHASGGGGRAQSPNDEGQGERREEDSIPHGSRVVSVEVLEPGSPEFARYGSTVYNLQVSNHPSYSVNEHLVHNCTMIKNGGAKRSRLLKRVGKTVPFRYALTGQPIENRPEELFSIMQFVDKDVLGDFKVFDRTFIVRDHWGKPLRYRNLDRMYKSMQECMVRLTRDDIADQLPDIIHQLIPVPFDPKGATVYRRITNDLISQLSQVMKSGGGGFNLFAHYNGDDGGEAQGQIMSRLTALRMLCDNPALVTRSADLYADKHTDEGSKYAHDISQSGWLTGVDSTPKLTACLEYIREVLEEDPDNKVVLFSFFKENLRLIQEATKGMTNSVLFMGGMSAEERQKSKETFASDPNTRLFLSSDAGGYGVDLPMANFLVSFDLPWSSGKLEQREARIIRLSSEFPHVTIATFVMAGSIEERQYEMLQHKKSVNEAFIDGKHHDQEQGLSITVDTLTKFLQESQV